MLKLDCRIINKNLKQLHKVLQLNRVKILLLLDKKETCACKLVEELELPNNLVSHHLKILTDIGLIGFRKEGLHRRYFIKKNQKERIKKLMKCITSYADK